MRPGRIRHRIARALTAAACAAVLLSAHAQDTTAPSLPPAPTPTPLYPGVGATSSYAAPDGSSLYAWQSLYLPIHSRLMVEDAKTGKPVEVSLAAQVSIRNTDPRIALEVTHARLHNADGKLVRDYLPQPLSIPPLGSRDLFVPHTEAAGSSLIIEWSAERPINPPLVEALHSDSRDAHAPVFTTTARPIQTR